MRCPKCRFNNPEGLAFCGNCGQKFERICPACSSVNPPDFNFCGKCGCRFEDPFDAASTGQDLSIPPPIADTALTEDAAISIASERRHLTVLFSDLAGYTAMSETLDPEDVQEIMNRIFGKVAQIVARYEGYIDKFIGDAVMIIFGVPKVHEDDPFRAIIAARKIHEAVDLISSQVERRVGRPIAMHTGINTGLVVTDEMDTKKGRHGMTGDTINVAARLTDMAGAGEILVGSDTFHLTQGYFNFEMCELAKIKGKAEPVLSYRLLSQKFRPVKIHHPAGLRAELIGRKVEMTQLAEAVSRVEAGSGAIVSICGDIGTGKSRIVEEFKATLDFHELQWYEGHAHAYSQNTPYFPIIDLLGRLFQVEEGDTADELKEKIHASAKKYIGERQDLIPYVGTLFSLNYEEIDEISPEVWKKKLQTAVNKILAGLARGKPAIICLEDLHWADHSSIELIRFLLTEFRYRILFVCIYRPAFDLFQSHRQSELGERYREIHLSELSPTDTLHLIESFLGTNSVPAGLRNFVRNKVGGNPFYLEELVNSLVESEVLVHENGSWNLRRPITDIDIPATLQGVISARLDRIEGHTRKVLQEAAVVGKAFFYDVLKRITAFGDVLDEALRNLERLDVMKRRSPSVDTEYIFKHALTQEVVYQRILRKEREIIHGRIGTVIEELYKERLPEFYELLAFHYGRSRSVSKAIDYLLKSAEKSFARYSLDESHRYYTEAFYILSLMEERTEHENELFVDLFNGWALVYNQRGDYSGLIKILKEYEPLVDTISNTARGGMFYGWLGWALRQREELDEAYHYLSKAIACGEKIQVPQLIGYACAWLTQTCADMGRIDEAITFGMRAEELIRVMKSDHLYFQFCMFGLGLAYYFKGECRNQLEIGTKLLDYGHAHQDLRSTAMGHNICGMAYSTIGDMPQSIDCFQNAIRVAIDPMISCLSRFFLGMSFLSDGMINEAEAVLDEVMEFNTTYGLETIGTSAEVLMSIIAITKGDFTEGVKRAEDALQSFLKNGSMYRYATVEHFVGRLYVQILMGEGNRSSSFLANNGGFLLQSLPQADRKAEEHLQKAINIAEKIGAKSILAQAMVDLGLLQKCRGRIEEARNCIRQAADCFEECGAVGYLNQANEILSSL